MSPTTLDERSPRPAPLLVKPRPAVPIRAVRHSGDRTRNWSRAVMDPWAGVLRFLDRYDRPLFEAKSRSRTGAPRSRHGAISAEIRRPSLIGNVLFLVSVGILGLWGLFLIAYLVKCRFGINLSQDITISRFLGL